ncbi:DNA-binding protein [Pedobacter mucosus]|uniref:DNA-binding protein n=1 Tax=Pedobacter mucosus TaxID=2895286 RepID=UPI001EE4BB8D|nr:DNA-binding protein [Pedobacter mucosus]UKT63262.1 DNA-binding protein [Pedobacter mucosus]
MKKIDKLFDLVFDIYTLLKNAKELSSFEKEVAKFEEQMTRQQVKDYLKISESTYKRKVKDGTLNPIKMPGGDRFYKSELIFAFCESKNRGRI